MVEPVEAQPQTAQQPEMGRVFEARRMQGTPHGFVQHAVYPWCSVCSLHRTARCHSEVGCG